MREIQKMKAKPQFFCHLAQKKKIGYCSGTVVLHTQYPARVTITVSLVCVRLFVTFFVTQEEP